jgi:hypothetical protein
VKIIDRTKLSESATSYRIQIDAEDLNHKETPKERYDRYLDQARRDTPPAKTKIETNDGTRRASAE